MDDEELIAQAIKILQDSGHDIDEIIHDHFSATASGVNNGGIEAQARFLVEEYGGNLQTIKSILE